jgi:hypothetical protein
LELLILKHPELTRHFLPLSRLAPTMLFLAIVRDPRDVVASMRRVREKHRAAKVPSPLAPLASVEALCGFYASHYLPLLDSAAELGERLMFARYEDVMRAPLESLGEIAAFCGADCDLHAAADFQAEHGRNPTFDREQRMQDAFSSAFWSDLYTQKISPERIGRYAESLSAAEVAEIESRLAPIGRRFGYWS